MDELLSLREIRTPVRLRFGRRSDERAVPHIFPQEVKSENYKRKEFKTFKVFKMFLKTIIINKCF